jgi:hypothetical protein
MKFSKLSAEHRQALGPLCLKNLYIDGNKTACQYDISFRRFGRFVARGTIFTFNGVQLPSLQSCK